MFTGIVETIGVIKHIHPYDHCTQLTIQAALALTDLAIGDSIAVNGVCLTVTHHEHSQFQVTAVPETLHISNLSDLKIGSFVNLERALPYHGRMSGHYVQGHVDGTGTLIDLQPDGNAALTATISMPSHLAKYIVNKGYITLDGMSITIIQSTAHWFTVTFIPHTQQATIIQHYHKNTRINIEVDILSKYIEKILEAHPLCNPI